ncbi:MAG: hypothetical protein JNL32_15385 [Candidatus Kapabacteria bacterium]|nr:hypothetical protein [Candidatus Kapabacteria bacterium]
MQCLTCGSESFGVLWTQRNMTADGKRSLRHDRRCYECSDCGKQMIVECEAARVSVLDMSVPKRKWVTIDEYKEEWYPKEHKHLRQDKLFDDE